MADDEVFFRFDTNAVEISNVVVSAMQRINGALSRPLSTDAVRANTSAFSKGYEEIAAQAQVARNRIANLFQDPQLVGDPKKMAAAYKQIVQETIGNIPATLAQASGQLTDRLAANTLPYRQIGQQIGREISEALHAEFKAQGGKFVDGTALVARNAAASLKSTEIPFSQDSGDPLVNLRNRAYLENYLRSNPAAQKLSLSAYENEDFGGVSKQQRQLEQQLGIYEQMSRVRQQLLKPNHDEEGNITGFSVKDTDTLSRISQLQGQITGNRIDKAIDAQDAAFRRLANSIRIVAREYEQLNGIAKDGHGNFFTLAGDQVTDPAKISKLTKDFEDHAQQIRNASQLLQATANGESVTRVPGFSNVRGYQGDFYELSTDKSKARLLDPSRTGDALKLQEINAKLNGDLDKQLQANLKNLEVEKARAANAAQAEARNSSGLLGGFLTRFEGHGEDFSVGLGKQIGSAAAFTAAYGSIFALQSVLRDVLHEFLDYQDSVTDLQVATRGADVVTQSWVNSLGELARVSGENVGAAMDTAARGVRAFTDASATASEVQTAGSQTAKTANQLALIAGKTLADATGDVLAIGTGFNLKPEQLDQVVDAVANAKRNVGGDAAQISQGLALISLSANQAGYSLAEAANLMGLVQSHTDESGQAIATRLTRVFQIVQGSTGKALAREFSPQLKAQGVNANSSVKDQLNAYAEIFNDPTSSQAIKDRILSGLGGTANQRELLPILKEAATLQKAYTDALNNGGQGVDEFNRKSNNLVGTLTKIRGDLKGLATNTALSGLFDFFGAGVDALEPTLHVLNLLLEQLNLITAKVPGLKDVLGVLADIAIAAKIASLVSSKQGLLGFSKKAGDPAAADVDATANERSAAAKQLDAEAANANAAANERSAAATSLATDAALAKAGAEAREAEATGAAAAASAAGGGSKGVGFVGGLGTVGRFALNPYVVAAAAVLTLGYVAGKAYDEKQAREANANQYVYSAADFKDVGNTAASFAKAAGELTSTAQRIDKNSVKVFGFQSDRSSDKALENSLYGRANTLLALAPIVQKEQNRAAQANSTLVFGGGGAITTVQQLADGMTAITANGGGAIQTLNAVQKALSTPPPSNALFQPKTLAARVVAAFGSALTAENIPKATGITVAQQVNNGAGYGSSYSTQYDISKDPSKILAGVDLGTTRSNPFISALNKVLVANGGQAIHGGGDILFKAAQDAIDQLGLDPTKGLTDDQLSALVKLTSQKLKLNDDISIGRRQLKAALATGAYQSLKASNDLQTNTPLDALNRPGALTKGEITSILNPGAASEGKDGWQGLLATQAAGFQEAQALSTATGDPKYALQVAKNNLITLRDSIGRDGGTTKQLQLAIEQAQHQFVTLELAKLDNLRTAAESRTDSAAALQAVRIQYAKQEFLKAGTDKGAMESLMESLDKRTVGAVQAYIKDLRDQAELAYKHRLAVDRATLSALGADDALFGAVKGTGAGTDPLTKAAKKKYDDLQAQYQAFLGALNGAAISSDTASGGNTNAGDVATSRAKAEAARLGGGIAAARADLVAAREALHKATPGTAEYFDALAQLYQAQEAMRNAVVKYKDTLDQLHGDITDPVEQARDALRAAARQLAADHGRGKDLVAEDQLAVKQAQAQLEASKFQQRLSDVQTAEQLGQISYQTYIRYLENESRRLHGIAHKTRQQIDEMNQIDLALKDAQSQADGFFNLGDIRTAGLVYQIRRFASAFNDNSSVRNGPGATNQPSVVNSHNTVTINGADTATVRRLLKELLGPQVQQRTTQSRRV